MLTEINQEKVFASNDYSLNWKKLAICLIFHAQFNLFHQETA